MLVLIVEDDRLKKEFVKEVLKQRGIDSLAFKSVNPAISYAIKHSTEIDGIVLDLGLTGYDYSDDYEYDKGLRVVEALTENGIEIPIILNSCIYVNFERLQETHKNLKMRMDDDEYFLKQFIYCLQEKKW